MAVSTVTYRRLAYECQAAMSTTVLRRAMLEPEGTHLTLAGMLDSGVIRSGMRVQSVLAAATRWMSANYRSESLYKNLLIQRALANHHDLTLSSVLPEFRVSGSIADCVVLNGSAHAYEIKTELDSSAKLVKQLDDYRKAFEFVSVVVHHTTAAAYEALLAGTDVGLLVLGEDGYIERLRRAARDSSGLDVSAMAKSLRKAEYVWVAEQIGGAPVDVPPVALFRECLRIGETVPADEYRVLFEEALRKRRVAQERQLSRQQFQNVRHQLLTIGPTAEQLSNLSMWMSRKV